jgi:hypothetical protein
VDLPDHPRRLAGQPHQVCHERVPCGHHCELNDVLEQGIQNTQKILTLEKIKSKKHHQFTEMPQVVRRAPDYRLFFSSRISNKLLRSKRNWRGCIVPQGAGNW